MFAEDDLTIRYLEVPKVWKWKNGTFRLCFLFPKSGRGIYRDDRTSCEFAAGDVLVLNTAVKGMIRVPRGGGLNVVLFHAFVEHLMTVFTMSEFCLLEKAARSFSGPWHFHAGSKLALKCHPLVDAAPRELDAEHRCHVLKIVAAILSEECKLAPAPPGVNNAGSGAGARIFAKLSLEQIQNSSIGELAKSLGYSRRHLNRLFHERFGISISGLKMEMRLLKAVTLLRDPAAKVLSVAVDCGFNHLSLFSARFKKRFGVSPKEWRRRIASRDPKSIVWDESQKCPLQSKGLCPLPEGKAPAKSQDAEPSRLEVSSSPSTALLLPRL